MMKWIAALWRPFELTPEQDGAFVYRLDVISGSSSRESLVDTLLSNVETKSGVLLTHISMMIAVTGLLLAIADKSFVYQLLLAFELVAYLILAVLCLRCQYQVDTRDFEGLLASKGQKALEVNAQYPMSLRAELFYRERIFRFVTRWLYFLTVILALTIMFAVLNDELLGVFKVNGFGDLFKFSKEAI
jgi:predicted neutral ceramidase superfamily lipid hydrolase